LDEYIGMRPDNSQSYHYFMQENFFRHINIRQENVYIPDGMAEDTVAEGRRYEQLIAAKGGIDLQVLGIGRNAHIGFNEPDVKFEATTHKVALDEETIKANARFFDREEDVPRYAISMGIKTIMLARRVILLASGAAKAEAVRKTLCGSVTPEAPAPSCSSIRMSPSSWIKKQQHSCRRKSTACELTITAKIKKKPRSCRRHTWLSDIRYRRKIPPVWRSMGQTCH
jgi:glucosamine-6-phosphate isomerase